jgi:hypothetical protein
VRVPRAGALEVEFSEPMNERLTGPAVLLAPFVPASKFEWKGRVFRYVLAESLRADQTYLLVVGAAARDVRGNALPGARHSLFSTGDSIPAGVIAGDITARGHPAREVMVWAYRDDLGHAPDSTARDFDALGIVHADGRFRLLGLPVPSSWRLFAFHDANRTQTFEPGTDHLTPLADPVPLTREAPRADSVHLASFDPLAPAIARGEIVDPDSLARLPLRLVVEGVEPPPGETRRWDNPVVSGPFQIPLPPGRYRAWLYRDLDRSGTPDAGEARGDIVPFEVEAGEERTGLRLVAPAAARADTTAPGGSGP